MMGHKRLTRLFAEGNVMDCPACQTVNPASARFCLGCGRSLVNGLVCSNCFTALPSHAHYCFHCGNLLVVAGIACTGCGANVPIGQSFCGICGTPVAERAVQPTTPTRIAVPPVPISAAPTDGS